jgi:hypothetical protein
MALIGEWLITIAIVLIGIYGLIYYTQYLVWAALVVAAIGIIMVLLD